MTGPDVNGRLGIQCSEHCMPFQFMRMGVNPSCLSDYGRSENMYTTDTIAAVSTNTMGNGGIGIIRISGDEAIEIADRIFNGVKKKRLADCLSHTIHYGAIVSGGSVIDEALVSVMKAPNTYTKEDVVEINCHGGILVIRKILDAVFDAGARPAEPGEFTKRAFLNGRIDLTQAESVIDIINSKNEYALSSSVSQLQGKLSKEIAEIREIILNHTAFIEAALDDPEHYELENYGDNLLKDVDKCVDKFDSLLKSADNGRILKDGVQTVILGKTNAGKSSLLNALAKTERAIVTDIEGTTRDVLEESINLDGIMLNLVDTAGIRDTEDIVEKIGINKAFEYADKADLIIYVADATKQLDENDRKILDMVKNRNVIVLLNKSDMENILTVDKMKEYIDCPVLLVSAKNETGMEELSETIKEMFFHGEIKHNDEIYITNARQKNLLKESINSLKLVKESIYNQMPEDCFTIDLMNAYESLGKIIGEAVEEDLVNQIFSRFCMGK